MTVVWYSSDNNCDTFYQNLFRSVYNYNIVDLFRKMVQPGYNMKSEDILFFLHEIMSKF